MKRYIIDLRDLTPAEKQSIQERLIGSALLVTELSNSTQGVVSLQVFWDGDGDFLSSPDCPSHCHCFEG